MCYKLLLKYKLMILLVKLQKKNYGSFQSQLERNSFGNPEIPAGKLRFKQIMITTE